MAKTNTVLIRLISTAGTGFFYVKKKNPRKTTEKLEFRKYIRSCVSTSLSRKRRSSKSQPATGVDKRKAVPRDGLFAFHR